MNDEPLQKNVATAAVGVNANLLIIFGITLMGVMGVASITPAFPTLSIQLGVTQEMTNLIVVVFTIPGVVLTPFLGIAADRFGRKRIVIPSLLLFGIAGFACVFSVPLGLATGLSPFLVLLVLRVFQGIGAAALGSLNITIIGDLYSKQDRTQVIGYNASIQSVGAATYPALGGLLALFGWFFPFYLPLIAIPIGIITLYKLETPQLDKATSLRKYFGDIGQLLKNKKVVGLFLISTTVFIMLYGAIITNLPFLVKISFNADSFIAGIVVSLISVASGIIASLMGYFSRRYSLRILLLVAFPFFATGLFFIPLAPTFWLLLIPVFIYGVGMGFAMPCVYTLLVSLAPINNRAALTSLNGLVLRLGQTLGPLIMAVVLLFGGIPGVYWVATLFALVMIPIVLATISTPDFTRSDN